MIKENLFKKLKKKTIPYLLSGTLFFSILPSTRCPNGIDLPPPPEKPVAVLTAEPTEGDAPLEVSFDASQSYARQGYLKEFDWDVDGDGNIDKTTTASETSIKHVYKEGGEFNASVVVVDSQGQESDKALEKIVVNEKEIPMLGRIAFWSNKDVPETDYNEDIYSGDIVIRDNNIELINIKRLTTDPGQDLEPAWSPNGKEILFTSHRTGGTAVWRMNEDGTNQRDITSDLVERARQANWGNNGKIVVAYRDLGDTVAGIGIIDPDIMGPDMNIFTPIYPEIRSGHIPGWPKWSPDCSKIVFQKYINENWEIFLMNSDGSNLRNLTQHPAIDNQPIFLPDGRVLFWSDRANPNQAPMEADLYVMKLDGSNVTRLTYASGGELDPTPSPYGKYILFTGPSFQLYLSKLSDIRDMNKWIQLTTKGNSRYPAWRPEIESQKLENILNLDKIYKH